MTKTDIANQICTHLNIVAPSLSAAKKDELLLLAEAVGLVLGQNRTPARRRLRARLTPPAQHARQKP